ncbi:MAG: TetR/AcrR family transcriptional regulator [Acidobacteriota bacterium]
MTSAPTVTARPAISSRRMSGEDRRQQIVRVATQQFSEKGFNGVTTKEIAAKAGVSEAIIFRHFATKQELYAAILDQKMKDADAQAFWERMRELAAQRDDQAFFEAIMRHVIERHRADYSFQRLLFFSALEGHELSEMFFQLYVRDIFDFLADYIETRVREGAFREVNPHIGARALFAMPFLQTMFEQLHGDQTVTGSPEPLARAYSSIFLEGIRRPAAGA